MSGDALLSLAVCQYNPDSFFCAQQSYTADEKWDDAVKYPVDYIYSQQIALIEAGNSRGGTVSISLYDFNRKLHHWLWKGQVERSDI